MVIFFSSFAKERKEVEAGGYGKRKRVEWIQNTEGYDEQHFFEISEENSNGWAWSCGSKYKGPWSSVNTIAPHRIVDFLRGRNFNIENNE